MRATTSLLEHSQYIDYYYYYYIFIFIDLFFIINIIFLEYVYIDNWLYSITLRLIYKRYLFFVKNSKLINIKKLVEYL